MIFWKQRHNCGVRWKRAPQKIVYIIEKDTSMIFQKGQETLQMQSIHPRPKVNKIGLSQKKYVSPKKCMHCKKRAKMAGNTQAFTSDQYEIKQYNSLKRSPMQHNNATRYCNTLLQHAAATHRLQHTDWQSLKRSPMKQSQIKKKNARRPNSSTQLANSNSPSKDSPLSDPPPPAPFT